MRDFEGRMQRLLEEEAAANSSANASLSGVCVCLGKLSSQGTFAAAVLAQERQRAAEAQAELLKSRGASEGCARRSWTLHGRQGRCAWTTR